VRMGLARSTPAARGWFASAIGRISAGACGGGGEDGKFFRKFFGAAMRTGCAFPLCGTDEDLAIGFAFGAMKLVNRHDELYQTAPWYSTAALARFCYKSLNLGRIFFPWPHFDAAHNIHSKGVRLLNGLCDVIWGETSRQKKRAAQLCCLCNKIPIEAFSRAPGGRGRI
jgi:hypothetical protein